MSDLDEKLKQVFINDSKRKGLHDDSFTNYLVKPDEIIPEIKQAFIDAGYVPGEINPVMIVHPDLMTGQEWYAKYQDNLKGAVFPHRCSNDQINVLGALEKCNEAAKKASGLSEEPNHALQK